MVTQRWHAAPPLLAAALALVICWLGFAIAPDVPATQRFATVHYPLLLVLWLASAAWIWRHPGCVSVPTVVAIAVALRVVVALEPPALSSDVYRYVWDGHVQRAGFSPYAFAPGDAALSALRDAAIHPHINRPTAHTVYPPGAQLLYLALPFSLNAVRGFFIACDLLTMLLIARLLRALGRDPARVLLYAWSPLAVFEVGNNGHLEAAVLPLLLAAVIARRAERWRTTGLWLGAAASLKLYPILLGLALAPPRWFRTLLPAVVLLGVLYLVYGLQAGIGVLGFLPKYVGVAEDHNIGLRAALEFTLQPFASVHRREVAFGLCLLLMAAGVLWISRSKATLEEKIRDLAGIYLLTVPTALHPWYVLWLVPWLCIAPRASWLWLVATVPISYLKYASAGEVMPLWIVPFEFVPTATLLAWEQRRRPT